MVVSLQTGKPVRLFEGAYAQAGFLRWSLSKALPRPLEVAVRWAWVDPDQSVAADVSRLELDRSGGSTLRDHRFRLQWDISF